MDSNNGPHHIGIGEREGKIVSGMVHARNFGLIHGIGRSGNISDLQPKAVGSSLLNRLTNAMTKNLLTSIGMSFVKDLLILPFATGMSLTLSFLTLRLQKPLAKYIIWSRIDQKTCLKCIITSGYTPIIINPIQEGDELKTDVEGINKAIQEYKEENILCIFTTTSCFAPRGYDDVVSVAKICKEKNLFHVVNNAYGIYCTKCSELLTEGNQKGKIDLIVSSTDKNFMVPVGGSLVYSGSSELIEKVKKNYPGRASMSPILDLFISFLQMGKKHYKFLMKDRKEKYEALKKEMKAIAEKYGERILEIKGNRISLAMTIGNICKSDQKKDITELGAMFFNRQISGVRAISKSEETEVAGYKFKNYGSSSDNYTNLPYFTFASAIGITEEEVKGFTEKFPKIIDEYLKKHKKQPDIKENENTNLDDHKE